MTAVEQQQQQHVKTSACTSTPSPVRRAGSSLLRTLRTSSGSLTGLLKGARRSNHSPPSSPPAFEVRGASMLAPAPDAPRPKAVQPLAFAREPASTAQQQQQQQQHGPPIISLTARAGGAPEQPAPPLVPRPASASPSPGMRPSSAGTKRPPVAQSTAGIDHGQQQRSALSAPVAPRSAAPPIPVQQQQQAITAHQYQNPLYAFASSTAAGGDSYMPLGRPYLGSAPGTPQTATTPGLSASATGLRPSSAAGTPHAPGTWAGLAAASNLTLANDSRPMSPGPFGLSAYGSGALPDLCSRPFTPAVCGESQPPATVHHHSGSSAAAPVGVEVAMEEGSTAVAAANPFSTSPPAFRALSPIKTMTTAAREAQHTAPLSSQPTSPYSVAAAATVPQSVPPLPVTAAGPTGLSPSASVAATPAGLPSHAPSSAAYRVPIFDQNGKLVGYKQNRCVWAGMGGGCWTCLLTPFLSISPLPLWQQLPAASRQLCALFAFEHAILSRLAGGHQRERPCALWTHDGASSGGA